MVAKFDAYLPLAFPARKDLIVIKLRSYPFESQESSSPIVTRAVAAGLVGQFHEPYLLAYWKQLGLRIIGHLPQKVALFTIPRFEALGGLSHNKISHITIDDLVDERLQDYAKLNTKFPCITVGSALGGASAHLSLALGGPFLPQPFVLTLLGGSANGDVSTYFNRSINLAKSITKNNPHILAIQHFDPVHDQWMTRHVNHLRLKLLSLPDSYAKFIEEHLIPGGAICYLDCQAQWLRYRINDQCFFQVGGWGDIPADEYLSGSERLKQFSKKIGSSIHNWQLMEFPIEKGPESEWGSEPAMLDSLMDFCNRKGFQFLHIKLPDPEDFSRLAYYCLNYNLEKEERKPSGILIEMFSQFDPMTIRNSGLLPIWLVFNTHRSKQFLESMLLNIDKEKPVFFSPLVTFTHTPDIVPWIEWEKTLQDFQWINVGARKSHYPADAQRLVDWHKKLREWVYQNQNPLHTVLTGEEILALVDQIISSPYESRIKLT